jgi:hypothetical protein
MHAVGDPRAIIDAYYLARLGDRRPPPVAVREEGDVIDQVAGELNSLAAVEGISVAGVGRLRIVEDTVNMVGLRDRLAFGLAAKAAAGHMARPPTVR